MSLKALMMESASKLMAMFFSMYVITKLAKNHPPSVAQSNFTSFMAKNASSIVVVEMGKVNIYKMH